MILTFTGTLQGGPALVDTGEKTPKRDGEKRLTLALDGETYRRLRLHAVETDQTHQAILEAALREHLGKVESE